MNNTAEQLVKLSKTYLELSEQVHQALGNMKSFYESSEVVNYFDLVNKLHDEQPMTQEGQDALKQYDDSCMMGCFETYIEDVYEGMR